MMKKIEKDFVLSDSSVNCYGFRLLTSGYQIDEYRKNPIGYFMHATEQFRRDDGVLVRWDDLRIDGDAVKAKPAINLSHPRGQRTADEIQNGFLNAASVGAIVVLESSEDKALKLPGQEGPTVTKWYNRECSLVDVPGNKNAVVLFDKYGDVINLSAFASGKPLFADSRVKELMGMSWHDLDRSGFLEELMSKNMDGFKQKFQQEFGKPYRDLTAEQSTGDPYKNAREFTEKREAMSDEEKALERLKTNQSVIRNKEHKLKIPSVQEQLREAFKEKTINDRQLAELKKVYKDNPYELYERLPDFEARRITFLNGLEWSELDKNGLLEEYKKRDWEGFKKKYLTTFGKEYKGTHPDPNFN